MTDTGDLAPEKIIINGQEFNPEEATQLVELGNKYRKMESDLNTSLDKVYPEYTKLSQAKSTWEKEKQELAAELEGYRAEKQKRQQEQEVPTDVKKIREAARQVGLADEDYLKEKGYMTREEVKAFLEEQDNVRQAAKKVLDQADNLEREIDGRDGRVRFNKDAVMAYAYVNNISDLRDAYDRMNEKDNAAWKQKQLETAERPGLTTLKAGGRKEPQKQKLTNDNLGQALGEWLNGIPEE